MSLNFIRIIRNYPRTFWAANTLELFERWAYYGIFNLLAIYLTGSQETGALGFSQVQKGLIMGIVNAILYFLPIVTGSIADKYGYKKVLFIAFIILSSGYFLMGLVTSFAAIFLTFFYVAIGAALFKPIISATISKTTDENSSSIGFGLFYMVVNIGAMIGPYLASELRELKWQYIFMMSSGIILLNLVILLIFYKETDKKEIAEPLGKSFRQVFTNIYVALKDRKFLFFLIIIIGGWTVYWQFFYSLPVFIEQWTSTSLIYDAISKVFPGLAAAIGTHDGNILPEKFILLDAFFIILLQIPVSAFVMRYKPINTMIAGLIVNAIGLTAALITRNGWILVMALFIFSIGEMCFSPKILEYISNLAPRDKAALYMGSNFLPMAMGNFLGGLLSGKIYEIFSDKYTLLGREIARWDFNLPAISDQFTKNDYFSRAAELMGMDNPSLTEYLWLNYYPSRFGFILLSIGVITALALIIYDKFIYRYK
jgi:POT family proton-dependent oligopeptide transporter